MSRARSASRRPVACVPRTTASCSSARTHRAARTRRTPPPPPPLPRRPRPTTVTGTISSRARRRSPYRHPGTRRLPALGPAPAAPNLASSPSPYQCPCPSPQRSGLRFSLSLHKHHPRPTGAPTLASRLSMQPLSLDSPRPLLSPSPPPPLPPPPLYPKRKHSK